MADYIASNAPFIDEEFVITAIFPTYPSGGVHNGYDLATSQEKFLYSMVTGEVVDKGFQSNGYGNYIIIKDNITNYGILYGHMKDPSSLLIGNEVEQGQFVGIEGATGNVTGMHVHIGVQDLTNHDWIFGADISQYIDPSELLGLPNTQDAVGKTGIYYGEIPVSIIKKDKKFNWKIFIRKIRNRY